MDLKDKTALVTGAGRGIGREIALALASCRATVIINDLDEHGAAETLKLIQDAGGSGKVNCCNVSKSEDVDKMIDDCIKSYGKLDILINNAGITRDTLLMRMKEEDWDLVLNVNLKSAFLCTKACARHMMKARTGRIVNIASVIGLIGNAGQANYAASKAGIIGLTKTTARELASRNVNVNAIAPGFIQTAMTDGLPQEVKDAMLKQIPLGILGTPKDVASAVLFLVSDLSKYITGQVITVDGGMVMS
ncbi:MAG: 3-oxoacyl-[acyl-carrier-protein] reductase [Armatimonadota bacterium]